MSETELKARELLARCLNEWGHHQEAGNVRDGEDLESYEFELRVIRQLLRFGFDTGYGHATRAPQWQPIETAPKDGTACIGFSPGVGCPILIRWIAPQDFMTTSECERYMDGCADSEVDEAEEWLETPEWWAADFNAGDMLAEDCQPTHWQPLPAPPEVEG